MKKEFKINNNNNRKDRRGAEEKEGDGTGGRKEEKRKSQCFVLEGRRAQRQSDFVSCSPPHVKFWRKTIVWAPLRETDSSPLISITVLKS